jgi:hypothetical protein
MVQHGLVGGLEHVLCFHKLGIIIPTDFHIFKGVEITNQWKGRSAIVHLQILGNAQVLFQFQGKSKAHTKSVSLHSMCNGPEVPEVG